MKTKDHTAHDYVKAAINYMNLPETNAVNKFGYQIAYKPIKGTPLNIGINQYPAWRLDYTEYFSGAGSLIPQHHNIVTDIFCVIDDTVFKLSLEADQFKYPEYLKIFQKVVYSFQMTPQQQ
jgi:hypothetical protein